MATARPNAKLAINCDMGEGFGLYKMGDDEGLMPHITIANVACGFHASDSTVMARTVRLAKQHNVRSAPIRLCRTCRVWPARDEDRPEELADCIIYQVGALKGFLEREGMHLYHIKPHGSLYGMAARSEEVAKAVADAAKVFNVPVMGMIGTLHERVIPPRAWNSFPNIMLTSTMRRGHGHHHPRARRFRSSAPPSGRCARRGRASRCRSTARTEAFAPIAFASTPIRPNAIELARAVKTAVAEYLWAKLRLTTGCAMAQHEVLSPLPGIFYRSPAPEKPPLQGAWRSGRRRRHYWPDRGDEAIYRDFTPTLAGKIICFLVDNEAPVEAGQAILVIETA